MLRDGVAGGAGFNRAIAFFLQAVDQRPADQRLVIDDKYGGVGR